MQQLLALLNGTTAALQAVQAAAAVFPRKPWLRVQSLRPALTLAESVCPQAVHPVQSRCPVLQPSEVLAGEGRWQPTAGNLLRQQSVMITVMMHLHQQQCRKRLPLRCLRRRPLHSIKACV